jgi:hypothetical protein
MFFNDDADVRSEVGSASSGRNIEAWFDVIWLCFGISLALVSWVDFVFSFEETLFR